MRVPALSFLCFLLGWYAEFLSFLTAGEMSNDKPFLEISFRDKVNSITFGDITSVKGVGMRGVGNAEDDLSHGGHLLVSDAQRIYSISMDTGALKEIIKTDDGSSRNITFLSITGLLQISKTEILVVDKTLNCVCKVQRMLQKKNVQVIAGKCQKEGGHVDGSSMKSRFTSPNKISAGSDKGSYFITEDKYVRKMNTLTETVSTIFSLNWSTFVATPIIDVKVSPLDDDLLYIATANVVYEYDMISNFTIILAGNPAWMGFNEGVLHLSSFRHIISMILLDEYTVLLADIGNQNLRVLDLSSSTTSTICLPEITDLRSELIKGHFLGGKSVCSISRPYFMFYSSYLQSVVILSLGDEAVQLPTTIDQSLRHKQLQLYENHPHPRYVLDPYSALWIARNLNKAVFHMVKEGQRENISPIRAKGRSEFPWVLTASSGERIEITFHFLALFEGESLKIYDGVEEERTLLRTFFYGKNFFGQIPDAVISKTHQVVILYSSNSSANTTFKGEPIFNISCSSQKNNQTVTVADELPGNAYPILMLLTLVGSVVVLKFCLQQLAQILRSAIAAYNRWRENINGAELPQPANNVVDQTDAEDAADEDPSRRSHLSQMNNLGSTETGDQENKLEHSDSDEDGYKNLKLKTSCLENNILASDLEERQRELEANLQREDNKKINIPFKKKKPRKRKTKAK